MRASVNASPLIRDVTGPAVHPARSEGSQVTCTAVPSRASIWLSARTVALLPMPDGPPAEMNKPSEERGIAISQILSQIFE